MKMVMTLGKFLIILIISLWVGLFIWTHQPLGQIFTGLCSVLWGLLAIACLIARVKPDCLPKFFCTKNLSLAFFTGFMLAIITFFSLKPSNTRDWQPEVSQMLDYKLSGDGKVITLYHVRNFDWQSETNYRQHWETRQYNLDTLQSVDLIASYWMGDAIAHTFLSFGFSDGTRVAFSIEIRKQTHERFTTWGGFLRNYEIMVIAADEKDLIYTRSNIRHEDVYIYPLTLQPPELQQLFLAYVAKARALKHTPVWYNSLTNNCTTAMYPLFNGITPMPFAKQWDYRWLVSGYFPNYFYDINKISHKYDFASWQKKAHINPKSDKFSAQNPITSPDYSTLIRKDF